MAEFNGRDMLLLVDVGGTPTLVAAVTSKSVTMTNETVDVTTDDSNGWTTLLDKAGSKNCSISVEGVLVEDTNFDAQDFFTVWAAAATTQEDLTLEIPSTLATNGTLSGTFSLTSFAITGATNGAVTFTAEFASSGEITYTAPSA